MIWLLGTPGVWQLGYGLVPPAPLTSRRRDILWLGLGLGLSSRRLRTWRIP